MGNNNKAIQTDPRFRGLERKVGIFMFIAIAFLLVIVFFMGMEKGLFAKEYNLYITVDSGAGFIEGMPIKLSGFKIGKVKSLKLTNDAKVRVVLNINKEYQKWIRSDSAAKLVKENVIGDSMLEISVGSGEKPMLVENNELTYEKVAGVDEFTQSIQPLLEETTKTLQYINDPKGDIKKTLSNVERLSEHLLETENNLNELLLTSNNTLNKLDMIASKSVGVVDDTKKISSVLAAKDNELKLMIEDTEEVLSDTREIIKGLKETWPVNTLIRPKNENELIPLNNTGSSDTKKK